MRLLTFSTLYPNEVVPHHGIFVETRLRRLVAAGGVQARVVAPVPWFPFRHRAFGEYASFAAAPTSETRHGLHVEHPRFLRLPKIGMTLAPYTLAHTALRSARRLLADGYEFDVIDAHYFYPDGVAAVMVGKALGKPVVITARGTDINLIPQHALPRRMILNAARDCAAMITVCAALKDELVALGADAGKITVLRNGVDLELFHPEGRDEARSEFGVSGFTLASVGHLIPRKGHELVIGALPQLPDATLLIAGAGPEEARLRALATGLGVAPRTRFLGAMPQQRLRQLYAAADALVLASSREGWANVLLEAMACGTPAVASNVWGTPEVVAAPEAGVLMDERSAAGVARAVCALRMQAPSRIATRRYAERFGWQQTVAGLNALLRRVVEPRGSAAARCTGARTCVNIALLAILIGSIPFVLKRPFWGLLLWVWFSIMNPHRLAYGFAYSFPFAMAVALLTLTALLVNVQRLYRFPLNGVALWMVVFSLWLCVSPVFSFHPDGEFQMWSRAIKIQIMALIAFFVVGNRKELHLLAWTLAISVGFFGIKGGFFTIAMGGSYPVWGPESSFIADNNSLALAIIMAVPVFRYLQLHSANKWVSRGCLLALLCVAAAVGSYSRGGLVALAGMALFLWGSRNKFVMGGIAIGLGAIIFSVMPGGWLDRMNTIENYQEDASAQGRINAWLMAWNLAVDRLLIGGGFNVYMPDVFARYAPVPEDIHAAHSIYFQVLGEHGFIGLLLFVAIFVSAWRCGTQTIAATRSQPELRWATDLAGMLQVSLIGYALGGAFLSLSYYDFPYYVAAMLAITKAVAAREIESIRKLKSTGSVGPGTSGLAAPVEAARRGPQGRGSAVLPAPHRPNATSASPPR